MNTSAVKGAIIRAKTSETVAEKVSALIKAVEELTRRVEDLETRLNERSR